MSIDFIGFIGTREASETRPPQGPLVQPDYIAASARAHEASGFDRALIAFHSTTADSTVVAQHAAASAPRLGLMIAHRPGFVTPTVAARSFATLDQITGGRVAVHIITGGDDKELQQDGDWLTKDERYARTDEYLSVMRQVWASDRPFDHEGTLYHFRQAFSSVRAPIPVYFGGASDAAVAVAGKHADIYALWGETHAQVREIISRVRASAAQHGRQIRFSLSFRPILAETEDAAWARADAILEQARAVQDRSGYRRDTPPENAGSQRLLAAAAQGSRLDRRLWTGIAALTGAKGNSTALVGTPAQVAEALVDYYDLGVSTFLIRGFDPLDDATDYGRELIPLTRELVARREKIARAS